MKPNCCIFLRKTSWYGSINIIVNILKTTNTDINLLLKKTLGKFKNTVNIFFKSLFITDWKKQINQFSDSKLKIYNICKNNVGHEKYLTIVNNFELRRSFNKLRTSSHRLQIELGRYQGVPRHNRVCTKCSSNIIEDELHFLFECSKYDEDRESMLFEITTVCSNFRNLKSKETDLAV
jgi:hypothetical protein